MSFPRSVVRQIHDVVISETTTPFIRCVSFAVAVSMGFLAYGPLVTPDAPAYNNPVFDGVFYFARPEAWGVGFGVCCILMLFAAITGRAIVYLTAVVVSTVTLMGWTSMIALEAWVDDEAFLSTGAYGLYIMSYTAIIGMALSPQQFEQGQIPATVLEDSDLTDVIQLRRTS